VHRPSEGGPSTVGVRPGLIGILAAVIRLNQILERGRRHPLLGPLVVILLVVLVVMTALHEGHESVAADAGLLCIGIVMLVVGLVSALRTGASRFEAVPTLTPRGPPPQAAAPAPLDTFAFRSLPLRR
jgi:peptidoglycan/LPS O-acetylase OafA/YrhL